MGKKVLGKDSSGDQKVMRGGDYAADMMGQLGLAIITNIAAQITYFYTDKVGVAVGAVGVVLAISRVIDAFTDVLFGYVIDRSKGGIQKYYRWIFKMAFPAALTLFLMFTVPVNMGQGVKLAYVLLTNVLLTAGFWTIIQTPYAALQIVRTKSTEERTKIGIFRAASSYIAGMVIVIMTIPITNMLGGDQAAWIKYGAVLAIVALISFLVCYNNGRKIQVSEEELASMDQSEEENVPFKEALGMLFKNKYWVMVLMFNLLLSIVNTIAASSSGYYAKWIFGNENLVAVTDGVGMLGTIIGFIIAQPLIKKLGARNTILVGLIGSTLTAAIRAIFPTSFVLYTALGAIGSMIQIPLMCLYGVITAQAVDYNEYKYGKKLVTTASGAIGFGAKVGTGLGAVFLSLCLALSGYDASLSVATESMRFGIYAFSNYLPIIVNVILFLIFLKFDVEKRLRRVDGVLYYDGKEAA